jgi:hypothetical protein
MVEDDIKRTLDGRRFERALAEEREHTAEIVRQIVDATITRLESLAESRDNSLKSTREEIRDLKREIAKFASLVEEVRGNTGAVDLPRVPLRSLRDVN